MQKDWRVFSVPLHRELKKGTLLGILKQAGIEAEDFRQGFR
jgi:predicted RNA binding protein YcfA (HicA-like mRNA interferase family)